MSERRVIAGRYELGAMLGRGGMGDVYRGQDLVTGSLVAIKWLHKHIIEENPQIVERFEREGEALRQLDHPSIVNILATVEENDNHYLIMEYVSGGSLRDLLDQQSRLPVDRVLDIALDLADALTRAHRLNIIHRDIKPDNVLLAEDGTPRLTDFGVAHLGDRTRLTATGSVIGTYAYLSPEACNGLDLDERADIWSFGVMLYEMLAGRVPFDEPGTAAILTAILTKPAPDLTRFRPDVPESLIELIYAMLEKERGRRVGSIRLVGAELEALIRGMDTPMQALLSKGPAQTGDRSRFATPSDQGQGEVPAMVRRTPGQSHGLSVYPTPGDGVPHMTPTGDMMTSLRPITDEAVMAATRWKWITVMFTVAAVTLAVVGVFAILFIDGGGGDGGDTQEQPGGALTQPDSGGTTGAPLEPAIVQPVESGEYMILVAQLGAEDALQQLSGTRLTDPSGQIIDDLKHQLETNVPFSTVRVRKYPRVITSSSEVEAIAAANNAALVVWGSYGSGGALLHVELGTTDAFPHIVFEQTDLERLINIDVLLRDVDTESVAPYVAGAMSVLHNASGEGYESMRALAILGAVDLPPAPMVEAVAESPAAYNYRHFETLLSNTPQAIDYVTTIFDLGVRHPLLYTERAMAYQRIGRMDDARSDLEIAKLMTVDQDWILPNLLLTLTTMDMDETLALFTEAIEQRPDTWFPLFFRGAVYYSAGMYDEARVDFEQSIALDPNANFPYVMAALLEIREGNVIPAAEYIQIILSRFPDPDYMNRLIQATFGGELLTNYGIVLSAFNNLVLRDYDAALHVASRGLSMFPSEGDLWLIQGFAQCANGSYAEAEQSYGRALALAPDTPILHLLRAEVRLGQDDIAGADADFETVRNSALSDRLTPYIPVVQGNQLNCRNFFSVTNPLLSGELVIEPPATPSAQPSAQPSAEPTAAVLAATATVPMGEPTPAPPIRMDARSETLILVAKLEPLGGVEQRDVTRFIVRDLTQWLVEGIPNSGIRIETYPEVLTSAEDALAAAEQVGAAVVVWGNYTQDVIVLEVQAGSTAMFSHIPFDRRTLDSTANVQVRLTSEHSQSIAPQVAGVLTLMAIADGDEFFFVFTVSILDALQVSSGDVVGGGFAANLHRGLAQLTHDTPAAIQALDAAIAVNVSNPIAFMVRAVAHMRLAASSEDVGQQTMALEDFATAAELAPPGWTMHLYMDPTETSVPRALENYTRIIALRPDDWYPLFLRGTVYYYHERNIVSARADFEAALALEPEINLPHAPAMSIALRQGRIADAQRYARMSAQFPDPEVTNRVMRALYGDSQNFTGALFAASTYLAIGQNQAVIDEVAPVRAALAEDQEAVTQIMTSGNALDLADLYMMQGIAFCRRGDFTAAEEVLGEAIEFDPGFTLLYVLRAQARRALHKTEAATRDFQTALNATADAAYTAWIRAANAGDWTCENFFDYELP